MTETEEVYSRDKSTVFSIVPFVVGPEFKPGLYPGVFTIPACTDEMIPSRLVVGVSSHLMYIPDQSPVRIITPSYQVANSIVRDYLDGQLFTAPDAYPGVCWIQGDVSTADFVEKNTVAHERIRRVQRNWFLNLVKKTSDDWNKFHSYRVVSGPARIAARLLNLDPEWLKDEEIALVQMRCPACGMMNDPNNAVCAHCRCVLNAEKFKKLVFA